MSKETSVFKENEWMSVKNGATAESLICKYVREDNSSIYVKNCFVVVPTAQGMVFLEYNYFVDFDDEVAIPKK